MKLINLSHKDPDIFQNNITSHRCNFILNHLEDFMHMYKNQGSTFWLRFIVSFKAYMEEKVFSSKKWLTLLINYQLKFIKVLNYVYICIHKKFIESSNNALEKFINNLITLALNSPSFLNYTCDHWITYFKSSKQLQNILQNILSLSGPCAYDGYTLLIYTVFADFLGSLGAIFEQWVKQPDLSEEEFKKIDYKLIYWLPPFNESEIKKVLCFEKYIADYWKEDLQRMLLTDDIHNIYGSHKTSGCCEKYSRENLFNTLQLPSKHTMELVKLMNSEKNVDKHDRDDHMHTITEVCMKDISILKPFVKLCEDHENCYVRIHHMEDCDEPFLCTGSSPCILTCNTNSKNLKKKHKSGKFWKNVSAEKFPIDGNKCDAATTAESYDKLIETYLHFKENIDLDISMSLLRHSYHCMTELHNLDFNPRRAECLNRLRKKLTQKNSSNTCQYNFSHPFYRNSLLTKAEESFLKLQEQLCEQRDHSFLECKSKCFLQLANTVAINSSDPFGRVISFSKAFISVPPAEVCECEHSLEFHSNKKAEIKKCESKKIIKIRSTENKISGSPKSKSDKNNTQVAVSSSNIISEDVATNIKATTPLDSNNEDSEVIADDEVDEILKLIGIGESEDVCHKSESGTISYEDASLSDHAVNYSPSNESETVENFLKLIGVNDNNCTPEIGASGSLLGTQDSKLKVCAYCKKKETQRKMFKKCSKCKEENFPVQHYYCSQECLIEDWIESHEQEHLKYQKR